MNRSWTSLLVAACLATVSPAAFARNLPGPADIHYDLVPGIGANGGTEIFEWAEKSSSTQGEPVVTASIEPEPGLRLRWLGTAGFEISDDESTILIDPFLSRPDYLETLLLRKLHIDTEAVDKYVFEPLGPDGMSKVKAVLVSHTHHDHAQDVPYILAKFPFAADRPVVVGDENVRELLKKHDGRVSQNPWLAGVEDLSKGPQKIIEFDKCDMDSPPVGKDLGYPVGTFGNFKITAYVNYHGLYDMFPNKIEGSMRGSPPFVSNQYRAYLHESMTYLIEYKDSFRIFATDSARNLNGERVAWEILRKGPVDILLQGIASRKNDNRLKDRSAWLAPRYFIPSHYDNFFRPMDEMVEWDYKILFPNDNSRLKEFIGDYCGGEVQAPCPALRMTKFGYYYGLENLIRR